jgi:SAM-dependent methyltransferase
MYQGCFQGCAQEGPAIKCRLYVLSVLPAKATVVEIGCGTGNYIVALADALPDYVYKGFDLSLGMLEVAQARSTRVVFAQGNADVHFPYPDGCCHLAFAVDVIHHIAARTCSSGKPLVFSPSEASYSLSPIPKTTSAPGASPSISPTYWRPTSVATRPSRPCTNRPHVPVCRCAKWRRRKVRSLSTTHS